MSTVATHFTRFQVSAAATAVVAAAVLTPAAIAQARPDLMPTMPAINTISTDMFGTDPILGPATFSLADPLCWVSNSCTQQITALAAPGASASPGTTVFEFTPLALVPGFLKPVVGWFLNLVPQFSFCIAGLGVSVGPYASVTVKTGAC